MELDKIPSIDQVWATDITYIPLRKGFLYLVAIMDRFSRTVLNWTLSNSLDTQFCMDALKMALASGSKLQAEGIQISWSGRRRCYVHILEERLWRTLKYVAAGFSAKPSRG